MEQVRGWITANPVAFALCQRQVPLPQSTRPGADFRVSAGAQGAGPGLDDAPGWRRRRPPAEIGSSTQTTRREGVHEGGESIRAEAASAAGTLIASATALPADWPPISPCRGLSSLGG